MIDILLSERYHYNYQDQVTSRVSILNLPVFRNFHRHNLSKGIYSGSKLYAHVWQTFGLFAEKHKRTLGVGSRKELHDPKIKGKGKYPCRLSWQF